MHVDVHVSGGRIAAIVGRGVLPTPGKVIDARDATVVPGFVDVHAHQSALAGERLGRMWLAYGVTTVRELAPDVAEAVERGEAWASGRPLGPRLIVSPAAGAPEPTPSLERLDARAGAQLSGHQPRLGTSSRDSLTIRAVAHSTRFPLRSEGGTGPVPYELELSPDLVSYQDALATLTASSTVLPSALGAVAGLQGWPDQLAHGSRGRDPAYSSLFTPAERAAWGKLGLGPAGRCRGSSRPSLGSCARAAASRSAVTRRPSRTASVCTTTWPDRGRRAAERPSAADRDGGRRAGARPRATIGTLEEGKIADFS